MRLRAIKVRSIKDTKRESFAWHKKSQHQKDIVRSLAIGKTVKILKLQRINVVQPKRTERSEARQEKRAYLSCDDKVVPGSRSRPDGSSLWLVSWHLEHRSHHGRADTDRANDWYRSNRSSRIGIAEHQFQLRIPQKLPVYGRQLLPNYPFERGWERSKWPRLDLQNLRAVSRHQSRHWLFSHSLSFSIQLH